MSHQFNAPFLKLNKNQFPSELSRVLLANKPGSKQQINQNKKTRLLKTWYKNTFQKNNRWNRSQIRRAIQTYSSGEIEEIRAGFELLFNSQLSYHQKFVRFINEELWERKEQETGNRLYAIQISQREYLELIHHLGHLKRRGAIKNTYKELASFIYQSLSPEDPIQPSTIIDRLKEQKGYKSKK